MASLAFANGSRFRIRSFVSSGSFVSKELLAFPNNPVAVDPMAPSVFFFAVVLFGCSARDSLRDANKEQRATSCNDPRRAQQEMTSARHFAFFCSSAGHAVITMLSLVLSKACMMS
jgi:hypothetical protein